jgi:hypothetical protein
MIVRTTLAALAALGLAGAIQSASAQQATPPPVIAPASPTMTAQATQTTTEPTATAPDASVPDASVQEASLTNHTGQCRWRRNERKGLEFVLIPLDLVREGLSALRRGTVASC